MTYTHKLYILFAFPVIFIRNKVWGVGGFMEVVNFIKVFSVQVASDIMDWPSEKGMC